MIFKDNRKNNILFIVICVLLVINVVLAVYLSNFDWHTNHFLGGFAANPTPNQQTFETAIPQSNKADDSYLDDTVFVGDSITYGISSYGYKSRDYVFAKIGLHQGTALNTKCVYTSKTTSYTIADALSMAKPGKIIVTLGINAIYSVYNDSFVSNYQKFIDKIKEASPDSVIILQSVFPVSRNWAASNRPDANNRVAYANDRIAELSEQNGLYYLNTYEDMVGNDGFAKEGMTSDGLHLSRQGYETVFNYILTHCVISSGAFTKIGAITPPSAPSTTSTVSLPELESADPIFNNSSSSSSQSSVSSQIESGLSSSDSSSKDTTSGDTSSKDSTSKDTSSKDSSSKDNAEQEVSSKEQSSQANDTSQKNDTSSENS